MIINELIKMKPERNIKRGWKKNWARLREQQEKDGSQYIVQPSMHLARESSEHLIEGNIGNS